MSIYVELRDLRNGAIFETENGGVRAVKSEYCYDSKWPHNQETQCRCVLLDSGKYAHLPDKNNEMVKEITMHNQ